MKFVEDLSGNIIGEFFGELTFEHSMYLEEEDEKLVDGEGDAENAKKALIGNMGTGREKVFYYESEKGDLKWISERISKIVS